MKKSGFFLISPTKTTESRNIVFRTFPQDEPYRQKLLADAGLDPEESPRLRSIVGPAEIRAILKGFRHHPEVYKPGERPESRRRESDSHGLENVAACRFRANFHIHTQYSDGRLSVPALREESIAFKLKPGWRYVVNVGSVGYPRADFCSVYVIYDTEKQQVTYRRLPFNFKYYIDSMISRGLQLPWWLEELIARAVRRMRPSSQS